MTLLIERQDVTTTNGTTPEGGVYITVKLNGAVAPIFDVNGNAQANPFQSAGDGSFSYYVTTPGSYIEEFRFNLADAPRTIEAITLAVDADSTLRTDLALSSGASLLGYLPAVGLSAQTLETALRLSLPVTAFHFGAVGDGVTNDLAALQAFSDWFFNDGTTYRDVYADFSGNFAISGTFNFGPTAIVGNGRRWNVGGALRVIQLTATFKTFVLRNFNAATFKGSITAQGIGSSTFASRTCGVGVSVEGSSGVCRILGGIKAYNFWYAGVHVDGTTINDSGYYGTVRCWDCGSGQSGGSLSPTFSGVTNNGVSGSTAQTTTLTGVSAFPASTITTYAAFGDNAVQVRIAGYLYYVTAMDAVAGTVTIFPWIDPAIATSGTMDWCFGGAVVTYGPDAGVCTFDHIQSTRCGRGLADGGLYGSKVESTNISGSGSGIVIGRRPDGAHIGTCVDGFYIESTTEHVVVIHRFSGNSYSYVNSAYALDLSKVWAVGDARTTAGPLASVAGAMGTASSTSNGYLALVSNGVRHAFQGPNLANPLTTAAFFFDQSRPSRVYTQNRDSQTVTLTIQGAGEYNRLFGYRGGNWRYVGSGTNGAPTGSFTFVPPTKAYTSCTTTNGSAVVTMASTAGLVAGMPITGTGIPGATTILSVDTALQITLSANATAPGTVTLTVTGSINGTFANVVLSNFNGPADFAIHHTDTAQLVWNVFCVAGKMGHGWIGVDVRANVSAVLNTTTSLLTQYFDTAITATRTVTLPAGGKAGRRFRIVRTANATGAFNINVNQNGGTTLKALTAASTWCDVEDDGTDYRLMAAGSL